MSGPQRRSRPEAATGERRSLLLRPKVWASLVLLVALGVGGQVVWRQFESAVAQHPQYLIPPERIDISPPPPWIRSDIRAEVLRDAGLAGTLSVLDDPDALVRRVRDAFELHPWVAAVPRIRKSLPAALDVELVYRRPVAAVETTNRRTVTLTPVDASGVRLPEADFTDVELRYLPRISGVAGRPLAGEPWDDERVLGAARVAAGLADVSQQLRLVQILPSPRPQVRGEQRFYTFEILTSGGTHVLWGAAPNQETLAGESPFAIKRERLVGYAAEHGLLDSIDGPARLDVRIELVVVPRTARRKPAAKQTDQTETK